MRLIIFDASSFMAHFRRFYSNVTSLTYSFPPRNTLAGMIAAVLGYDKEAYYRVFSRDLCKIALAFKVPVRKETLNIKYLNTDSASLPNFRGEKGTVPTNVEFVLPAPPHERLQYRIFVTHFKEEILDELVRRLEARRFVYPPSLGPAYCLADLTLVADTQAETIMAKGEEYEVSTVVREDYGEFVPKEGVKVMLEERLPPDLGPGRTPCSASYNYIYEYSGRPVTVKVVGEVFRVQMRDGNVYGVFM